MDDVILLFVLLTWINSFATLGKLNITRSPWVQIHQVVTTIWTLIEGIIVISIAVHHL